MQTDPGQGLLAPLCGLAFFVVSSGIVSAAETAIFAISGFHLEHLRAQGRRRMAALDSLLATPRASCLMLLTANTVCRIGAVIAGISSVNSLLPAQPLRATVIGCATAVAGLLVAAVLGKAFATSFTGHTAMQLAAPLNAILRALGPVARSLENARGGIRRRRGKREVVGTLLSEQRLRAMIETGDIEGLLSLKERAVIDGILEFRRLAVVQVMLPRTSIEALPDTLGQEEMLHALRRAHHSRIPLFHESIDKITGIVHAKGVLLNPDSPYQGFVREPLFVPEKRALTDLLGDFQRRRLHLAVVVDEYGGTAGIVSLGDLLKEIINAFEEDEEEVAPIRSSGENRWVVHGTCEIGELNEQIGASLPAGTSRTIGGFVTALLGRFPRQQETVRYGQFLFTVLRMDTTRVRLMQVELSQEPADEAADTTASKGQEVGAMTTLLMLLAVLCAALLLGALFSGLESATLAANRLNMDSVRLDRSQHVRDAYRLLSATQSVINLAATGHIVCIATATASLDWLWHVLNWPVACANMAGLWDDLLSLAVLSPVYLLVCVIAPRRYFHRHPSSLLLRMANPVLWLAGVFLPATRGLTSVMRRFLQGMASDSAKRERSGMLMAEDLVQIVGEQRQKGEAGPIEKRMIFGIFGLEQTIVREIMQPLVNVSATARNELTGERVLTLARESGYSRIPVYTNRIVNIDGVVRVLPMLRAVSATNVGEFVVQPYYVPESLRAHKLMRKMIRDRVDLAVVVDEFGGTVGLVTQEDVLEEIVGEIEDEFDPMRPTVLAQGDGSFLVEGRMDVDDCNERFGTAIPNVDYDTLGGFVYDELGRIPRVGDAVENTGLRIEVLSMDGKRIERLKLIVKNRMEAGGTEEEAGDAEEE